jgi:hypothetical protein
MLSFADYLSHRNLGLTEAKKKRDYSGQPTLFDFIPEKEPEVEPEQDFDPRHQDLEKQLEIAQRLNKDTPHHTPPTKEEEGKMARADWKFDKWDDLWMRQVHEQAPGLSPTTMLGLKYMLATMKDDAGNFKYGEVIPEYKLTGKGKKTITLKNLHLHRKQLLKKMAELGYSADSIGKKFSHKPPGEAGHRFLQSLFQKIFKTKSNKGMTWNPNEHSLVGHGAKGAHRQELKATDPEAWEKHKDKIKNLMWNEFAKLTSTMEKLEEKPRTKLPEYLLWMKDFPHDAETIGKVTKDFESEMQDIIGVKQRESPEKLVAEDEEALKKEVQKKFRSLLTKYALQKKKTQLKGHKLPDLTSQEPDTAMSAASVEVGKKGVKDYLTKKRELEAEEDDDDDDLKTIFPPQERLPIQDEPEDVPTTPHKPTSGYDPVRAAEEEERAREKRKTKKEKERLSFTQWMKELDKPRPEPKERERPSFVGGEPTELAKKILARKRAGTSPVRVEKGYTMESFKAFLERLQNEVLGATAAIVPAGKKCGGKDYQCEGAPESMIVPKKKHK